MTCPMNMLLVGIVVVLAVAYVAAIVLCILARRQYVKRIHGMRRP
jgi:hypothetical protein